MKFLPKLFVSNTQACIFKLAGQDDLFFFDGQRRRKINTPISLGHLKAIYPDLKTVEVDAEALAKLEPGAPIPRRWYREAWIEPPQDFQSMREIIVSRLKGVGVEYGAGSRPAPVPVDVEIEYVEPFQSAEQYERMNFNEDAVVPKYANTIEDQEPFEDESLDFIIASNVIEHTPNPIGAIAESYRTLKKGGQLVLMVPDKRFTFDGDRKLTTLDHLQNDYENYQRENDLEHYLDYYQNVLHSKNVEPEAKIAFETGEDLHLHVWKPASFYKMCEHVIEHIAPFKFFELKPRVLAKDCIEFYAVFHK
ncbi:MAG: methyltransferase domain-containing protein [Kordiimonadaceae bacterium]|nr:methyltransferase domain-containing protein [Kordiimonadaceae bacterium]